MNFWKRFQPSQPILALAPLYNVTDAAFRKMFVRFGKPDILWTEFTSASGLSQPEKEMKKGFKRLSKHLRFQEEERPIVAQLFTGQPNHMYQAAKICQYLGFDGIDINMGCPDKNVLKQRCGAATLQEPWLAQQLIAAARFGAPSLPVSIKIRVGLCDKKEYKTFLPHLLFATPESKLAIDECTDILSQTFEGSVRDISHAVPSDVDLTSSDFDHLKTNFQTQQIDKIDAITIHFRTAKQSDRVPSHWTDDIAGDAVRMVREISKETKILGNGGITSQEMALDKISEWNLDGAMIGRAAIGNPFIFNPFLSSPKIHDRQLKIYALMQHAALYNSEFCLTNEKSFKGLGRHLVKYLQGCNCSHETLKRVHQASNFDQLKEILYTEVEPRRFFANP